MPEDASSAANAKADAVQRWGGRVPVVIGAIGHRDIRPADGKLAAALRGECRKLKKQYSASPFIVLSALAEGADRLIARIAMEELDADLIAVLPMPAADYERDFPTEDSKGEFRAFLDRALYVRTATVPEGDSAWKVDGEPRNKQYACGGAHYFRPFAHTICDLGWPAASRHRRHGQPSPVVRARPCPQRILPLQECAVAIKISRTRTKNPAQPGHSRDFNCRAPSGA